MIQKQLDGSPAGVLLVLLQRKGALTVKELEKGLGVTATAVRQQIANLLAERYIEQRVEHSQRGRPRHVYSLTPKGHGLFPQHYDELTYTLLREILVTEGPQKVQVLLARMGQRLAEQYAGQMAGQGTVDRAQELSELLNAKGIMAEIEMAPNAILFHEYNCPYYQLAREYRAICDMEQGMISQVVHQPVSLISCTLDGHHGCQFKIENE
jgi:predicted ArsR family transcriptional regulator